MFTTLTRWWAVNEELSLIKMHKYAVLSLTTKKYTQQSLRKNKI